MEAAGWTVIVTYRPQDGKYDISINGIWHRDMVEAPSKPRELARIHRIREADTEEDQETLTTYFKMLIDGEMMLLKIQYSNEIQQLRVEMAKFKAIASGKKCINSDNDKLFPFFVTNHSLNIRFAVLLDEDNHSFDLIFDDNIRWN